MGDGTTAIVFNGEIYNYRALRQELEEIGYRFRTSSDTEVVLYAYEQWKLDCPKHLQGMFAFAIYDQCAENGEISPENWRLLLARDRLGIKPLYWQRNDQGLLFASEVRAVLASGKVPRRICVEGMYTYLAMGSVQEPLTLVEGVHSLPPAAYLLVESQRNLLTFRQHRYWTPPQKQDLIPDLEEVRSWLVDAVGSHLNSDVPLGTFLSGGVDSGTILALGSRSLQHPMQAFTLGFNNPELDERDVASRTARYCHVDYRHQVIRDVDILIDMPQALASMDQPTLDGINSWYVSREARRAGLTVALSGVGGDELFAGYPSFYQIPLLKRCTRLLPHLKRFTGAFAFFTRWNWLPGSADARRKLAAYLTGDLPMPHPYFAVRGLLTQTQLDNLLTPSAKELLTSEKNALQDWQRTFVEQLNFAAQYDEVGEISWLELSQYMLSTLLRDIDMMSMAHSLEVRVPFVDHFLVERVLRVPQIYKRAANETKPLLTRSLQGILPPEVTHSKKRTFTFPFQFWLNGELAQEVEKSFVELSDVLHPWIRARQAKEIWLDFRQGHTNWTRPWSIYVLNAWAKANLG